MTVWITLPLGHTAYLAKSTIIKQGYSSQGSYCVNHIWMIDYPVGWTAHNYLSLLLFFI